MRLCPRTGQMHKPSCLAKAKWPCFWQASISLSLCLCGADPKHVQTFQFSPSGRASELWKGRRHSCHYAYQPVGRRRAWWRAQTCTKGVMVLQQNDHHWWLCSTRIKISCSSIGRGSRPPGRRVCTEMGGTAGMLSRLWRQSDSGWESPLGYLGREYPSCKSSQN